MVDLYGSSAIAKRIGNVSRNSVSVWITRYPNDIPPPAAIAHGASGRRECLWDAAGLDAWVDWYHRVHLNRQRSESVT